MSVPEAAPKRRARRIAADEAHSWARNLRLGNHHAKSVLRDLTLYVDSEGFCFVGIDELASNTELSPDTVRKRLAWLEQIGAIARWPQWIDASGVRNGEGRGKRTTDKIRLLTESDEEAIEARARGPEADHEPEPDGEISPRSQQGLNQEQPQPVEPAQDSVRGRLALGQPSDSGEGLNPSNLNHEPNPPNPPSGGVQVVDFDLEEFIAAFCRKYPAPITNLPRLRLLLTALEREKRQPMLTALEGYASFIAGLEKKKTPRAVKDADRWVSGGLWQGFLQQGAQVKAATERAASARNVRVDSPEGRAWLVLYAICGLPLPPLQVGRFGDEFTVTSEATPAVLAFVEVGDTAPITKRKYWRFAAVDSQKFGAWRNFLKEAIGRGVVTQNVNGVEGLYVPWPWPPLKDGSISPSGPGDAISDEDAAALTGET